jgi:DNA-binding HxlR family transcriptional regulator
LPNKPITDRALTTQLRQLESYGLIDRLVTESVPPRVDYRITTRGLEAIPVITALQGFGGKIMEWEGTEPAEPAE